MNGERCDSRRYWNDLAQTRQTSEQSGVKSETLVSLSLRVRQQNFWINQFVRLANFCTLSVNRKKKTQQAATIRCLLSTSVSKYFGHHYAHLQENKDRATAFGVLLCNKRENVDISRDVFLWGSV